MEKTEEKTMPENVAKTDRASFRGKLLKKGQTAFLTTMLAIPILHWLVFWLYVNLNSIFLAFKTKVGEWSLSNFKVLFHDLASPDSSLFVGLCNTLKYFLNNVICQQENCKLPFP